MPTHHFHNQRTGGVVLLLLMKMGSSCKVHMSQGGTGISRSQPVPAGFGHVANFHMTYSGKAVCCEIFARVVMAKELWRDCYDQQQPGLLVHGGAS